MTVANILPHIKLKGLTMSPRYVRGDDLLDINPQDPFDPDSNVRSLVRVLQCVEHNTTLEKVSFSIGGEDEEDLSGYEEFSFGVNGCCLRNSVEVLSRVFEGGPGREAFVPSTACSDYYCFFWVGSREKLRINFTLLSCIQPFVLKSCCR